MEEWKIFLTIGTIITFCIAVIKPIVNLTTSITKLAQVVENLQANVTETTKAGKDGRQKLWEHNDEQDKKLGEHDKIIADHEARIKKNEQDIKRAEDNIRAAHPFNVQ